MNTRVVRSFFMEERDIDRGLLAGLLLSVVLVSLGIILGGRFLNFINLPSLLLVVGGTFGATLVHFPFKDITYAWKALKTIISESPHNAPERIDEIVRLAQAIRLNGPMVLESIAQRHHDPFFRLALQITVDGQPSDDIRRILETERRTSNEQASRAVQVFETMGTYAPALGLIGTLIGLIQMLGSLDNPSSIGPAMSLALITTLYGAILANLLLLPIAGKLRNRADEESTIKALTAEGVISLSRQENAIIVEQRLQSFLPTSVK